MATKMKGKVVQRDFWGVRVIVFEESSPSGQKRNYASVGGVERFLIAPADVTGPAVGQNIEFHAFRNGDQSCKVSPGVNKRLERWVYCGE